MYGGGHEADGSAIPIGGYEGGALYGGGHEADVGSAGAGGAAAGRLASGVPESLASAELTAQWISHKV